jgi:cyclic beta-1,2-glucan synthetase
MLNPANHARSPAEVGTYKVEPYVMAADLYAVAPHSGRGGWTWYTGSAGWMYQLVVESLLGLHLEGSTLRIAPCFPPGWRDYKIHYRYRDTLYHITVTPSQSADGPRRLVIDGVEQTHDVLRLVDDRREHSVEVGVGVH